MNIEVDISRVISIWCVCVVFFCFCFFYFYSFYSFVKVPEGGDYQYELLNEL